MDDINLLPLEEKQELRKQALLRAGIVFFVAVTILFLAGAALLVPSVFLVVAQEKNIREGIAFLEKNTPILKDKGGLLEATRAVERKRIILQKNDSLALSPRISATLARKTFGVRVTGLLYEKTEEKKGVELEKFIVEGVSSSRDALVSFAKALEDDAFFENVELPVGNLVQSKDIPFSLAMRLTLGVGI